MNEACTCTSPSERDDVRELVSALHQDRLDAKEKERRDSWTKYVSLMIVVFAVATAIGSLKSAAFGSKVILNQAQASDMWSFYQAKSIKRRLSEMDSRTSSGADASRAMADAGRYRTEEAEIQQKAKNFERARDEAAKHGTPLGFAIASLQISIAVASVCLITKRKLLWVTSGLLGLVGLSYLFYGLYGV